MRSVQPVFDRHCIACHGLAPAGKDGKEPLNLIGTQAGPNLIERKLISWIEAYHETGASKTNDYFSVASPLTALLRRGHHDVTLAKDEWTALILWMDLGVPHYSDGHYGFNNDEDRRPDPTGEQRLRETIRARFGEALAAQPFNALVNVGAPEKSRVLLAALPLTDGGWGQLPNGFKDRNDSDYRAMLSAVQGAIAPLTYHDVCGTCGRGSNCVCNSCWVWMGHFNESADARAKRLAKR
jgi:hypothetical protein